jgi:ribosomal protein L7/L12
LGKIIFYGWNIGFNKVAHAKLLRAELGYSLLQAKSVTDSVLDRKSVTIEVADDQIERLALELNELGVKCRVDGIGRLNRRQNEAP